jgi:hypothetical protein
MIRKEENMKEKELLLEELRKWTVEYEKAREAFNKLLPNAVDVSLGEKLGRIVITEELLDKYDEAERRMNDVSAKRREVMEKIRELGDN